MKSAKQHLGQLFTTQRVLGKTDRSISFLLPGGAGCQQRPGASAAYPRQRKVSGTPSAGGRRRRCGIQGVRGRGRWIPGGVARAGLPRRTLRAGGGGNAELAAAPAAGPVAPPGGAAAALCCGAACSALPARRRPPGSAATRLPRILARATLPLSPDSPLRLRPWCRSTRGALACLFSSGSP